MGCGGPIRAVEHPLWSPFVWRNEVSDTFVETVAAPWFARAASRHTGDESVAAGLGANIGRGVWCESYWLPEADLVTLGRAATVNRGCVVQTHLFHDRVMRMDTVVLEDGATLGPHCVALPAARIGAAPTRAPERGYEVFEAELDTAIALGGLWIAVWHPFVSGRPSRLRRLEALVERARERGAWFAPLEDIAAHVAELRRTAAWTPRIERLPYYDAPVRDPHG